MPRDYIPSIDEKLTYINKDSFIHRWNPRVKIVTCLVSVFLISGVKSPRLLGVCYLGLLGLIYLIGLKPGEILKKTSVLFPFIVFMGLPILLGGGLPIASERKTLVALLALKSLTSLYLMFIMFFTQPMEEFLGAMAYLKIPDPIMSIVFLSWRYIFVLGERFKNMFKALSSRLFEVKFNSYTFKVTGQVMGGMLIKSLDTSDTVYNAMAARGFDGSIPVTRPRDPGLVDLLKAIIILGPIVAILIIERW